ncbi:GntR family transcriptional regulator [Amycolatopsis thailandensis]|uniref:GntR family transcriptional regulator n=1 Tax=Amycolatopsis thailandensis TaxID=589330 RepID=UPI0036378AF9
MTDPGGLQRGTGIMEVARTFRTDIESGRYRHEEKLPTQRVLAEQFGTSNATISRALDALAAEGLVIARPRVGVFVNYPGPDHTEDTGRRRQVRPTWIAVGGYAGSGKTEVGRIIARLTGWGMFDKDTSTRPVVEAMLSSLDKSPHDRESETYLKQVRPAEYEALRNLVLENISCGNSAIMTAPFTRELNDPVWCHRTQADADAHEARLRVIWVRTDADSMKLYLKRRDAARDVTKLANWDRYLDGVDLQYTPAMPHAILDNSVQDPPLQRQVEDLLERWGVNVRR